MEREIACKVVLSLTNLDTIVRLFSLLTNVWNPKKAAFLVYFAEMVVYKRLKLNYYQNERHCLSIKCRSMNISDQRS